VKEQKEKQNEEQQKLRLKYENVDSLEILKKILGHVNGKKQGKSLLLL